MMWFLLLLYVAQSEPMQGDVRRLTLKNGSNPCEGHIEIFNDGQWGYVGDTYWNKEMEKVVCKSTHCGIPEPSSIEYVLRPSGSKVWLNEMSCIGNESHLWDCTNPGWGISQYQKDFVRRIKCSNTIKVTMDGFKCAGAVQYSTDGNTLSGYFCGDNWGQNESNVLCKSLGCGEYQEIIKQEWVAWKGFKNLKKMTINCLNPDSLTNLWQCAPREVQSCQKPAFVMCSGYQRLQLRQNTPNVCSGRLEIEKNGNWAPFQSSKLSPDVWCQKISCGTYVNHSRGVNGIQLTCTDNVEVVLMDNGKLSSCYGAVYIKVNASSQPVCASDWTRANAEVLCRELNCGNVISEDKKLASQGIMDYVKCSGKESSLWHCRAKRDNKPFPCNSIAYIVCAASIDVRLADSPGKCAGRVEIQHEGRWKSVIKKGWTDTNSDIVCRQLKCGNKRNSAKPEKFSQGSGDFLAKFVDCKSDSSNISECIRGNYSPMEKKAVGITCEEHKVVFLEGNSSCSGRVGIEYGSKTYWLSGSNETWNQELANTVCRQMNCGYAALFNFIPRMRKDIIWYESYSCSSNTTSLFQCENKKLPSNHSDTIANVTCSGKISVSLTKECWGNVKICMGEKCGGVCNDTWTDKKSVMLCKSLGCGDTILRAINQPEKRKVIVKSLHTTKSTTNLAQCNLVENDENDNACNENPAHVICSGSAKTRINAFKDKCSGNVEVYYEGQWLPVCTEALKDIETQNIICRELTCGQAVRTVDYFGPKARAHVISHIQCSANGNKSLTACSITADQHPCTLVGLQCSSWSKMELKLNKEACSGALFVHSEGGKSAVSNEGWNITEGIRLCRDLECGKFSSQNTIAWDESSSSFWKSSFSCAGVENPKNIWDCEKQTPPTQKQLLFVECQDEPKVALSGKCGGEVTINKIGVCDSHWSMDYSHMVCQELNCSNALSNLSDKMPRPNEEYYHISCEKYHHKLGQCKRFKAMCDGRLVSVYCTKNVKFKTTDKCGGQIVVNYRNKWENVQVQEQLSPKLTEKLCEELDCNSHNHSISNTSNNQKVNLETTLYCTKDNTDIKHCVFQNSSYGLPSEIYCDGYVNNSKSTKLPKTSMVPIILGVGFILVLLILLIVFVPICIVKKVNGSSKMLSRDEIEFESGHYEDITSKANEIEDFTQGRFRSESEVIMGSDARSTSSFPYDDIDEAGEAWPLTSQAATAGAPGDDYIPEEAFDQNADGVTYEVNDPQEHYDDIEASPEITCTKAEVHNSPQTTPESVAVAPLGLVQEDDDYLVPGQDG